MCGIFGIFQPGSKPVNLDDVQRATRAISHRGPDDEGYLLLDTRAMRLRSCGGKDTDPRLNLPPLDDFIGQAYNLVLGFRRLAILDLSPAGHQPMSSPDGQCWIILNGEIYNFIELRRELETLGYSFHSTSDTEVLLAAYNHWGVGMLPRLVGMFAFCILDLTKRKMLLGRDFFAIKPFYYSTGANGFAFASEIKALLELPFVERVADPQAVYDYLLSDQTDHSDHTFFTSVRQLPAAHYLVIDLDSPQVLHPMRYWQLESRQRQDISFDEAAAHCRSLFLESLDLHLRSDVPVGAALSGGIDSSAIVAGMRHLYPQDLQIHTFSYIADDSMISEECYVDLVGSSAQAIVHKTQPSSQEMLADFHTLVYAQDEPFGGTSIYAQNRIFRLAAENGIKVTLDGQGADEVMGGYRQSLAYRLVSLVRQARWGEAAAFFKHASRLPGWNGLSLLNIAADSLMPRAISQLGREWLYQKAFPAWLNKGYFIERGFSPNPDRWRCLSSHAMKEDLQRSLFETILPQLLRYDDRNAMQHSIESRVPFLNPRLVSFLFSLPEAYLIDNQGMSKSVFRQAMQGIVPAEILQRRDKIGFKTTEKAWLNELRPDLESILQSDVAKQIPVLHLEPLRKEWEAMLEGHMPFKARFWRQLNLILWARRFEVRFS